MRPCIRLRGRAARKGFTWEDAKFSELVKGIAHEKEHTDDPYGAMTIALDHLAEIPNYYTLLERMERAVTKSRNK
jgi:hypothetical protein